MADSSSIARVLGLPALFVVGTDTDVGKTFISCAIAELLAAADHEVTAVKPIAAGGAILSDDSFVCDDSAALCEAMTEAGEQLYTDICGIPAHSPLAGFLEPMAPWSAALLERKTIDVDEITKTLLRLKSACAEKRHKLIVEGAGGVLVPLDGRRTVADLVRAVQIPAVLVGRTELGTINHTLLSVEALKTRGVEIAAVIFSRKRRGPFTKVEEAAFRELRIWLPDDIELLLAMFAEEGESPSIQALP